MHNILLTDFATSACERTVKQNGWN